jgi:hypothetical protein
MLRFVLLIPVALAAVSAIPATGKAADDSVLSQLNLRVVLGDLYPGRRVSFADGVTGLPDVIYIVNMGYRR